MGQEVLGPLDDAGEDPAGGVPGPAGRRLDGGDPAGDVVRKGDRRAVRSPREGLGRADGNERPRAMGRRDFRCLEGDHRVAALAVGGEIAMMEVLHRGLRMERDHRVLELVRPEAAHHVRRDEHE